MSHTVGFIVVGALILFGLYRRTRRTIGFQKLVIRRMITRMTMLCIVGVLFLLAAALHPVTYAFDALGIVLGGIIAYYATRTTSFEWRNDAWYYRPNPWIGVLLLVLFFARIIYRVYVDMVLIQTTNPATMQQNGNQAQMAAYSHDPLTAITFFMLVTYYVVYYTFVIRKEKHLEQDGASSSFGE